MKSAVAAITALASVATAYSPGHHMYFPRSNATTTAAPGGAQTTLTVIHTQMSTIISCAPTVTDCPADKPGMTSVPESDRVTNVVTHTVELTKTVCPVSEAEKVSSSVINDHKAGKITGTPLTSPPAQETGKPEEVTTVTSKKTVLQTITITMGGPNGPSAVPTVITSTADEVQTVPKEEEPTTTTTATSTMTRTITIANKAQKTPVKAESCDQKPAETVTVTAPASTVTVPASTVYVTVPCDSAAAPAPTSKQPEPDNSNPGIKEVNNKPADNKPANNKPAENKPADNKPADNKPADNKPAEEECPPDVTTTKKHTVTVVPVPYPTNGTHTGH